MNTLPSPRARHVCLTLLVGSVALLACGPPAIATAGSSSLRFGAWITYWDYDGGLDRARSARSLFDDIFFFVAELGPSGRPVLAKLVTAPAAAVRELRGRGVNAWLTVVNDVRNEAGKRPLLKDSALIHRMLSDPDERLAHRQAIVDLAITHGFSGVDIDYENLQPEDRDRFTAFVRELAPDLAARGVRLSVTVQPKRGESRSVGPGAADWAQLCQAADRLQVMLYNQHSARTDPGPLATPAWITEVLAFARAQCDPRRIVPVLKVTGMDWGPKGVRDVSHGEAIALAEAHGATLQREAEGETPYFRYVDPDGPHTVYFEDAASVSAKVAVVDRLGLGYAVLWSLGKEDPRLLPELQARKGAGSPGVPATPSPTPAPTQAEETEGLH